MPISRAGSAYDVLRDRFPNAIVGPGDAGWDAGRMSFNLLNDQRPEAVARPASATQTAEIVRAARDLGLRVHVQGTSHNTLPAGSLTETLLVRFDRMAAIKVDVEAEIAGVEAGARWRDVVPLASELGLSALHGSSPEVNIAGYSLGGGVGWQARKRGLQANSITAIEVVTADGEKLRVDADNGADLFWALRGGSGNFAVVTKLEFQLYPVDAFYAGAMFFGFDQAADVLHAWCEWARQAPEEVTTSARMLRFPDLELVPDLVRGKSFTVIDGAFLGDEDDGADLLRPLRALGPQMDTLAMLPPAGLSEMHMDPVHPIPYLSAHSLVDGLSAKAIDDAVAIAGSGFDSLVGFELRHGGGALSRTAPGHGAIDCVPGEFLTFMVALVLDPAEVPGLETDLARLAGVFAPYDVGRYLNFTERSDDVEAMFPAGTLPRLRALKAKYDPDNVLRANHAIDGRDQT